MFATVRRYPAATPETIESLTDRADEINAVLASVPGSEESLVIRSREGLIVVVVGVDEQSVMESSRRFFEWSQRHVVAFRELAGSEVWAGDVLIEHSASRGAGRRVAEGGRP